MNTETKTSKEKTDALFERLLDEALNDEHGQSKDQQPKPQAKPEDLYQRLMKKKKERDEKVERMRKEKHEEETRQFKGRFRVSSSRVQTSFHDRDAKRESTGRSKKGEHKLRPAALGAARTRTSRAHKENMPQRSYRQSSAGQSAESRSRARPFHGSSAGLTSKEGSSVFEKLYTDALRRREERDRREELLEKQEAKPFKVNTYWGSMLREAQAESMANTDRRIGDCPDGDSQPAIAETEPQESPSNQSNPQSSPPQEILISPPICLREVPSVRKRFSNHLPWQSPPKPIRKLPPPLFLDPIIASGPKPHKEKGSDGSFPSRLHSVSALSSFEERIDGETSEEDNSIAQKTEYGSI